MANTGYGGINYGTANKQGQQGIVQNQNNIANNQNYKQSEIDRTLSVIADRNKQGLDTADQQKYLNVNLGYQSPMMQAAANVNSGLQATYTPPTNPTQDTLGRINDFISNQSQFQYKAPEAFSYDQNSDPAYLSQLAEAKRNIQTQQVDTNAMLRASGQGQSSWSESTANQIGTKAMDSIANNLVPTLMNQAYQRYNDSTNRDLQVQQLNYGVGQDAIGNLGSLYGLQDNEYFQKPIAEAQLTGNYLPNEARQAIDGINTLKKQAETKGITASDRSGLSMQADELRATLQRLGVDPSFYGADKTSAQSSQNNPGIRTLQGQQLDASNQAQAFNQGMNTRQQNFAEGQQGWQNNFQTEQQAYRVGRDSVDDTYRNAQQILSEKVQLGGLAMDQANHLLRQAESLGYVTPELAAATGMPAGQVFASQANQENNVANNNFAQLMEVWKSTGVAPAGINGVPQGTRYGGAESVKAQTAEGYATSYLDKAAQYDQYTGIITNVDPMENMILESGLSSAEMKKLYVRYGIPLPSGE